MKREHKVWSKLNELLPLLFLQLGAAHLSTTIMPAGQKFLSGHLIGVASKQAKRHGVLSWTVYGIVDVRRVDHICNCKFPRPFAQLAAC